MGCNGFDSKLKKFECFFEIKLTDALLYYFLFACSSGRFNVISASYRYLGVRHLGVGQKLRPRYLIVSLGRLCYFMICHAHCVIWCMRQPPTQLGLYG